jgi:hypothetical protein
MEDTALDKAKQEVLDDNVEESVEEEGAVEEEVEEEIEEDIEDALPQDHKERSNLGRKISALLNKSDKLEDIVARQQEMIELIGGKETDETDDEFITKSEFKQMISHKDNEQKQYENDFKTAFNSLADDLTETEKETVGEILLSKYNEVISGNGTLDGAKAFNKAYVDYLESSKKRIPLKNKRSTGVTTKQTSKKVMKKLPKLDAETESYLDYIKRTRGAEVATRLHKSL